MRRGSQPDASRFLTSLPPPSIHPDEAKTVRAHSLPDDHILPRHILRLPYHDLTLHLRRVQGSRDPKDDSVGVQFGVEVGFEVDGVFYF